MSPLLVPIGMPLESAFRGIVSIPAAALATQLLPVSLCNRLSWSVMMVVMCAAALLVVVVRLAADTAVADGGADSAGGAAGGWVVGSW
jgi:hypothetical protein